MGGYDDGSRPSRQPRGRARGRRLKDLGDRCVVCGKEVLWEEAVQLFQGQLAHPECEEARRQRINDYNRRHRP